MIRKIKESDAIEDYIKQQPPKANFIKNIKYKGSECDLLHITDDFKSHEYEFKVVLALNNDFRKFATGGINMNKHKANAKGLRVNYFTYVLPKPKYKSRLLNSIDKRYGIIFIDITKSPMDFDIYREASLLSDDIMDVNDVLLYSKVDVKPLFKRNGIRIPRNKNNGSINPYDAKQIADKVGVTNHIEIAKELDKRGHKNAYAKLNFIAKGALAMLPKGSNSLFDDTIEIVREVGKNDVKRLQDLKKQYSNIK